MAAAALFRSRARRSAWVACARLWTLYKAATSARAPTAAAKLRQAPATARRCPTENALLIPPRRVGLAAGRPAVRSEEHTSELQSHSDLVCRLLLEKKKQR